MKTAGYVRVSTDGQIGEDKFGIAVQRHSIEQFCISGGHELTLFYIDEAVSGAGIENRTALNKLLADAGQGIFQRVIVAKLDRLARDLFSQLWIEKELLKHGVDVYSLAEPYNGHDPVTTAMRQMIGVFAQLEKGRITERMTSGRKQKAMNGGYAGGGAPIGYKAIKGNKNLLVDEEKIEAVNRTFELKEAGLSYQKIADCLNNEGHTTARGKPFSKVQVKRILDRRMIYEGNYRYSGIESTGKHAAILKDEQ